MLGLLRPSELTFQIGFLHVTFILYEIGRSTIGRSGYLLSNRQLEIPDHISLNLKKSSNSEK